MEPSSSNIKKFLIFFEKKAFLIFLEMKLYCILGNRNPPKIPYISGNEFFYILENGNPEKIIYILGGTSKAPKTKIPDISRKKVMNKFF